MTLNEFLALNQIDLRSVDRGTVTIELFNSSQFGDSIYEKSIDFLTCNLGLESPGISLAELITVDNNYGSRQVVNNLMTVNQQDKKLTLTLRITTKID